MKRIICGFILAFSFLSSVSPAFAQTTIWTDATGPWESMANWNNGVPNSTTDAQINNGGTAQINASDSALNVVLGLNASDSGSLFLPFITDSLVASGDITVGDSGTGTMGISLAGLATSVHGVIGNAAGSSGVVTVDGGFIILSSRWTMSSDLTVGNAGTGTLAITNGAIVSVGSVSTIANSDGSTGTVTVDGMGSTWTNTNNLFVGGNGNGTLHITNGGSVSNLNGIVGTGTSVGANGTVTVDGMGSTWMNNGFLFVGNVGPGTLSITNGAVVSDTDGTIGNNPNSNGTVTVDGVNSTWTNTGTLTVGNFDTGTLHINNGGAVSNTDGFIGTNTGANGTVTVDGMGSTWTNSGTLDVGLDGNGSLNITNGGAVTVNGIFARISEHATSTSSVTVEGPGSTLTVADELDVARAGTGTLTIQNGGTVNMTGAGRASIGVIAGSNGTATVDGMGSTWTTISHINVGENGNGTLHISGGGQVASIGALVATNTGSTGLVTIDGAGSSWGEASSFLLGNGGHGTLHITNGGALLTDGGSIGTLSGAVGVATVDGMGSSWTNPVGGGFIIGDAGSGTLTITNGAMVSGSEASIAAQAGSDGSVTVDGTNSSWSLTGDLDVGGNSGGPGGTGLLQITNNGNVATTTATVIWNGGTVIVDGTLNSAAGGVSVMSGGFLGGIGTVVGTVTSSGTVSPGDSPGTFVIIGGYTQNSDGLLKIEIGGLNAGVNSDLLYAAGGNGHANLDGTLQLIRINNFRPLPGDRVNIINDDAGHSGTFSSVDLVNWGLIQPEPMYDETNDVYVVFQLSQTFLSQALTPNQKAVAKTLDEVVGDPRADDLIGFVGSEPPANLPHDYDLIAPEELASIYEIGFSQAVVTNMNLQHRMDDIRAGSTGFCSNGYQAQETGGYSKNSDGKVGLDKNSAAAFVPSPENRWGFFVTGSGDFVNVGDDDLNAHGYDITTGNVIVGADYRVCDHFAVGIDGGYSGSTADLVDRGRVDVDGGKAGAYATVFGYKILGSMIHIDGAVSGGWNSYDTNRTGLEDLPVLGSTNGTEFNAMLAYGGDWHFGCLLVGTWSSLQYTNVSIDGFTETGSLAPLHIEDQDHYSLRGTTGVRLAYDIKAGRAIIRPEVRAAWQHESGDRAYSIDSRFASGAGDVFTVHGPAIGRDSALVDAGLAVQLSRSCSLYVYYDGVLGRSNYDSHAVSGGVRFGF